MEKRRISYCTSLLLALMILFAPLRVLIADKGVTAKISKQSSGGTSYNISITNASGSEMTGWTVSFSIPNGSTYQGSWNCKESVSGSKVTLTSQYDWQNPKNGETMIVAGFNLSDAPDDWSPSVSVSPTLAEPPAPPDPAKPDPAKPDPAKPDPAKPDPAKPDPAKPDPAKPDPANPDPVNPDPAVPTPTNTPTPVPATPTPAPATATPAPTAAPGPVATATPVPADPTKAPKATPTPKAEKTPTPSPTEPADPTPVPVPDGQGGGTAEPVSGDDWLTTDGNHIVDSNGTQVWLTGLNWFGYNTGTNIFDGCWSVNMADAIKSIADHGFNLMRIPMSAELVLQWKKGEYPTANFNQATNSELVGMNSQEIFDYALALCAKNGIKVMLDIHSANTDGAGHMTNLWYTDKVSLQDYYDALSYLADRYKDNDTVVAYDLKNEPHGKPSEEKAIWNDSTLDNNWKYVAETAGNIILDINPHALIMIEGIEIYPKDLQANGDFSSTNNDDYYFNWWGGNLRGVKDYPIDFGSPERNKQIVYSPHDYGPAVYAQPWFDGDFTYDTLKTDCWNENWLYIYNDNIAPLLIGEWGGFMTEPNLSWMTDLRQLIGEYHINHTFWCYNANSGDTGGLVLDDFMTWDEEKYAFVREVLWQQDGKFVGLDHAVPLGANGISLSEYAGVLQDAAVTAPSQQPSSDAAPVQDQQAAVTPTPVTTYEHLMVKHDVISARTTAILCGVIAFLALILGGAAYMCVKRPKQWNNFIDRFYLPEKLKRDIPWEIEPDPATTGRARILDDDDGGPTNNEFAGKYRPVKKDTSSSASQGKGNGPQSKK